MTDGRTDRLTDGFAVTYTALAKLALRGAVKMAGRGAHRTGQDGTKNRETAINKVYSDATKN